MTAHPCIAHQQEVTEQAVTDPQKTFDRKVEFLESGRWWWLVEYLYSFISCVLASCLLSCMFFGHVSEMPRPGTAGIFAPEEMGRTQAIEIHLTPAAFRDTKS